MTRNTIQTIQTALAALGHYPGPVTGKMCNATMGAIVSFKVAAGRTPDYSLTIGVRRLLYKTATKNNPEWLDDAAQHFTEVEVFEVFEMPGDSPMLTRLWAALRFLLWLFYRKVLNKMPPRISGK